MLFYLLMFVSSMILVFSNQTILIARSEDTNTTIDPKFDVQTGKISWRGNDSIEFKQLATTLSSFVILHEHQEIDEGLLRREFEHLKTFLANNMPLNGIRNPLRTISSWITSPLRGLWPSSKRQDEQWLSMSRSIINDTIQMVYNRLIDYGFKSVGISDSCRELAICNTSNFILTQMPAFVQQYGHEHLMNLPTSVFGNHNFTNAWLVGLSSTESSFCPSLFACEDTAGPNHDTLKLSGRPLTAAATKKIPIQMDQKLAFYLDPPAPVKGKSTNNSMPFMFLVQVIQPPNNTIIQRRYWTTMTSGKP